MLRRVNCGPGGGLKNILKCEKNVRTKIKTQQSPARILGAEELSGEKCVN